MATAEDECGEDTVLGKMINRATAAAAPSTVGAAAVAAAGTAAPATLPFTGADLLPFAITGLGMIGAGAAMARRKR